MGKMSMFVLNVKGGKEKEVIKVIKGLVKGYEVVDLLGEVVEERIVKGIVYIEMIENEILLKRIEKIVSSRGFIKNNGVIEKMCEKDVRSVKERLVS
jgi:transcription antitermination factor NusG